MADQTPPKEIVVALKGAHRHYTTPAGVVRALDGVDLEIRQGEFAVLAGPSGSGKSTMLNLIGALDQPTGGEVYIDGVALSSQSKQALAALRRDRIGFVFQSYNLIPVLTVLENVEYVMLLQGVPEATRHQRAKAILAELGLEGMLNRRPVELSGGQQQRVAVARAVVSKPALVLADEPTANLDSQTSAALMDAMMALNQTHATTFICSTHDPDLMARASRLIKLRDGKLDDREEAQG
ncbi:ABC transporter ATP-binding protein [Myxococcota bacterium]|nr:ABC transporter ATP-binding protein [Myxococcota bacterium]MBU1432789.1 ABC transporter ATP-binding protein [Myxococcota bacterium]MBU1897306.1 ABC transporter ATP-binding protein [Myxococcota bacterium]